MKIKEAFKKFFDVSGIALFFAVAVFLSFELYAIYIQSLLYLPVLIILLAVFGILFYFKYNKKLKARYFILAYLLFIVFLALFSIFLFKEMFVIFLIVFDLAIPFFILLTDEDEDKFMKKQKLLSKIGIYFAEGIFALAIFILFATSIFLVLNTITPQQTPFLTNINATIYYSSSSSITFKSLNDPNILNFFYFFNPANQTEIKGIANVIRVDNTSYNNSFRAYCLNAETTKYWIQGCISYLTYSNIFSNGQNYMLSTEIWQGQKPLLNVAEIIPNASIYKNQTFYLKLVVKNNTEIAYETNNGRTEYIKVVLPKNESFGIITNNSSMNTEIHEDSYYAINTGPLNYYALNTTLTSLSGNFTGIGYGGFNYYYGNSSLKEGNNTIFNITKLSNNSVKTDVFYFPMNSTQLKDLKSIENGSCESFFIPETAPVLLENYTKLPGNTPLNNIYLCNSNETLGEYLKSINKTI